VNVSKTFSIIFKVTQIKATMFSFTIKNKDNLARTGVIKTIHGELNTPAFIPVATRAAIKALSSKELNEIGFESLLCNTYHLYLRPGSKTVQKLGGLHGFMGYPKITFTDSGGFQVFSLNDSLCKINDDHVIFKSYVDQSKHKFTPEKSMQIQHELGADIIFTFDECIHFDDDYKRTKEAMKRTHEWTKRCITEHNKLNKENNQALFGIVQGGKFKKLREESAKFISSLDFPGFGIGGIFGDPSKEIHNVVKHTMQFLPEDKPKHMLGIGSVEDLFDYVECGADTFDCVLPTRLGRLGYAFILPESGGNVNNKFRMKITSSIFKEDNFPLDKNCSCHVCVTHSRAYIRHLYKSDELLFYSLMTYHNLWYFCRLMENIRESIENGTFDELKKEWVKN
jgi:queuine tRNA-ribosyltransferase